jgi:AraC-like DNA-binding protein
MFILDYLRWKLGINKRDGQFHFLIALIFVLGVYNCFYKFEWTAEGIVATVNLWNPSWLLFGPLLFCAYRSLVEKSVKRPLKNGWHLVPFFAVSCWYVYVLLTTDFHNPWANKAFALYQNSYFVIVLSMMPYSMFIASRIILVTSRKGAKADTLIMSIAAIYVLISLVILTMVIGWGTASIDLGVDFRFFSYGLLLLSNILIGFYWVNAKIKSKRSNQVLQNFEHKLYKNSALTEELALEYKQRIIDYFEEHKVYLESNLSLEFLTKELNIPKHHFSQLFNQYFEKNFHHFVADYRIAHAIELLEINNGKLTIESLAYTCGFNSKTSLNRYFKEKTGVTPSQFQYRLLSNAQCA